MIEKDIAGTFWLRALVILSTEVFGRDKRVWRAPILMLRGLDEVSEDGLFAQRHARFQPMQPFHENEPLAIAPDQDRNVAVPPSGQPPH